MVSQTETTKEVIETSAIGMAISPAGPGARKRIEAAPGDERAKMTTASAKAANSDRQAPWSAESSAWSARTNSPPVLHSTPAKATSVMP